MAMTEEQFREFLRVVAPGAGAGAGAGGGGRRPPILEKSDAVSFKIWRNNFQTVVDINEWEVQRAKREAKAALTDEAAALAHDIDIQPANNAFTLAHLLEAYEARFVSPAASALAVSEFQVAKQEPLEPAVKFHSRLRGLYMRAYPANADGHNANLDLINHFITKLKNSDTRMHCFTANPQTYANALAAAQLHESALLKQKAVRSFIGSVDDGDGDAEINAMNPNRKITCWYKPCGGAHSAHDCLMLKEAQELLTKLADMKSKRNKGNRKKKGQKGKGVNQLGDGEYNEGQDMELPEDDCNMSEN